MDDRYEQVRDAVLRTGTRFAELTRAAAENPGAMATRDWTVEDTAAHVLSLVDHYVSLFDQDADRLPVPDLPGLIAATTVNTVNRTNAVILTNLRDRSPERLARGIEAGVGELLAVSRGVDPERTFPWLGGSRVPAAGLLAHLLNEFLVHGWDMSRGLRRDWPMPDADAGLFVELFLVGVIRHGLGELLGTDARPSARPISVEFRSAYTAPVLLVLEGRQVRVGHHGEPVDARVTFRPARFNLMLFGRTGVARALVRRDITVGGRRPWLLPAFLRVVHLPQN